MTISGTVFGRGTYMLRTVPSSTSHCCPL